MKLMKPLLALAATLLLSSLAWAENPVLRISHHSGNERWRVEISVGDEFYYLNNGKRMHAELRELTPDFLVLQSGDSIAIQEFVLCKKISAKHAFFQDLGGIMLSYGTSTILAGASIYIAYGQEIGGGPMARISGTIFIISGLIVDGIGGLLSFGGKYLSPPLTRDNWHYELID